MSEETNVIRATERRKASAKVAADECARMMAAVCYEKRAEGTRVLDLRGLCPYTDFLVLASAGSRPQMRGILREIERQMCDRGWRPLNAGSPPDERWSLMDFGDMVVHLFGADAREYYALEQMWADAPELEFEHRQPPAEAAEIDYESPSAYEEDGN